LHAGFVSVRWQGAVAAFCSGSQMLAELQLAQRMLKTDVNGVFMRRGKGVNVQMTLTGQQKKKKEMKEMSAGTHGGPKARR
jgi:hypothetical protein